MDHRNLDSGLARLRQPLVVLAQAAVASQPGERAFHDPSLGEHGEPRRVRGLLDQINHLATDDQGPDRHLSGVAAVGPDHPQARVATDHLAEDHLGAVRVLKVGG